MTTTELARTEHVLLRMAAADILSWRDHVLTAYDSPLLPASDADVVASLTHRGLLDERPEGHMTRIGITSAGEHVMHQLDDEDELDVACAGMSPWTWAVVILAGVSGWGLFLGVLWWALRSWA